MPYIHNGIEVVTLDELVPEYYKSYDALNQAIYRSKDKLYGPKRALNGGNGREMLVVFSSLPGRIREKITGDFESWMPPQYR